ncbi:MAG: ABC transporter ATP-binding protein [Ignavibacteriae bacterium]|nr:MAG: ABC transporter ATP-binding protein [Ignavibacteriota bacterium]
MITVAELAKVYPNGCNALKGVSFNIEKGEVCGYLGANGAGKSTTIKILTGMIKADSGSALIGNYDVKQTPEKVKRIIGYVPESGALFQSLTPFDFLEFVCKIYDMDKSVYIRRIYEFLEMFELKNEVNTPMASFSKGMRQKVLIISSLIHNPDVIFWDEPLSGIDFNTTVLIRDIVKDLSENGKTFFYSTHLLDIVEKICTRVIILNDGNIVFNEYIKDNEKSVSLEEVFKKYIDTAVIKQKATEIYKNLMTG